MDRSFKVVPTPGGGISLIGTSLKAFVEHIRRHPENAALYFRKPIEQCKNPEQEPEPIKVRNSTPPTTAESPVSGGASSSETTRTSRSGPGRGRRKQEERIFKISPSS